MRRLVRIAVAGPLWKHRRRTLQEEWMSRLAVIALSIVAVVLGLTGCPAYTDLGVQCLLVKGQDAEGNLIYITNAEIVPKLEYLSHGGECDTYDCVRDADMDAGDGAANEPASGYCSNNCVPGAPDNCVPANSSHADPESAEFLSCREISLDPELLAYFRDNDPEQYRRLFGDGSTPFYCARGDGPGN